MTPWLTIIGMGEDGYAGLSPRAKTLLEEADVIVGSRRLLSLTPVTKAIREEWPQPFSAVVAQIKARRGQKTAILATGDPSNYGVARKIFEFLPAGEVEIIPHISAFSLAAARLGWSLPDCDALSLHGRPAAQIEAFIQPGARLIALTENGATIAEAARRLVARGYGRSPITILENMGGADERQSRYLAKDIRDQTFSDLNTITIECVADGDAARRPRVPGLPDEAYVHDGQITKRETRAVTIAALGPTPDALLWDVGAGCGSIAIEWMRGARGAQAYAIERDEARLKMLAENADRLGTPRLRIVPGDAPKALEGLPAPDAVFIGGGMGDPGVFEASWDALKPGGCMVANVVTLEGELHLIDLQEKFGGELVRIDIAILSKVGALRALKPRMPVLQWRAIKP
jgi:precorrin-6Y C5,15-methyltransferase (decarboxylating)